MEITFLSMKLKEILKPAQNEIDVDRYSFQQK